MVGDENPKMNNLEVAAATECRIETHVVGWLESCVPEPYSERQLEELDRLIEPWLDDYERTSRAARK